MDTRYAIILLALGAACSDPSTPAGSGSGTDTSGSDSNGPDTSASAETGPTTAASSGVADGTGDTGSTGDTIDTSATGSTTDTSDTTDTDGCASDCDDGIDCTDDACVDGACVNTPMDAMCDDGVDCTADSCDAAMGCLYPPMDAMCDDGVDCTADTCDAAMGCLYPPMDTMCDDGIDCTVDTCDAVMGCMVQPDDALCDDGVGCTADVCDAMMGCDSAPDDALCPNTACATQVCDAVLDCQPVGGTSSVLVYNGSNGQSTAPEDAVTDAGFTPIVVTDEAAFNAAFDAGGFTAIVVDIATGIEFTTIPGGMQTRLDTWVGSGERLIFGFWNLDDDPAMRATLDVNVTASVDPTLPIHTDPASPVDLFASPEMITSPIVYPDSWSDNGDQLTLVGAGFIAARFNDPMAGPGAILVTHSDHVITNGFMALEIDQGNVDADADMVSDGEELLRNELDYVCSVP